MAHYYSMGGPFTGALACSDRPIADLRSALLADGLHQTASDSLEEQLQASHHDRVTGLSDKLRAHQNLQNDEILSVLRSNPLTAPHAEVRAKEIISDLISADYRTQMQRFTDQLAAKDSQAATLQREADGLRQQLFQAQQAQQGAYEEARRESALREQAEHRVAALEKELAQRSGAVQEVAVAKAAAEKALSAAQARVTSMQASMSSRMADLEQQVDYFKTLAQKRDADMRGFEDAFQTHLAACGAKTSEWSDREQQLAATQKQAVQMAKALRSELDTVQALLETASTKNEKLEREARQLRKGKAQLILDLAELEGLLADSEAERRDIRERYIALGEKVELLLHEEAVSKEEAQRNKEAARLAVQDTVKDLQTVAGDCSALQKKLKDKRKAEKRAEKRLEATEKELSQLRQDLAAREKELAKAGHQTAAFEAKIAGLQAHEKALTEEVEKRKVAREEIKAAAKREAEDRLRLELKQQALDYERRIQELELQNKHFSANEMSVSPQDYLAKAEHTRILDSRLAGKEAELNGEMHRRLAQCERDWKWKLEARENELQSVAAAKLHQVTDEARAEQKRLSTQAEDLSLELRRAQAAAETLQESHDTAMKDYVRLKEQIRDFSSARDAALDQKEEAIRQLARGQQHADERVKQAADVERVAQKARAEAASLSDQLISITTERDATRQAVSKLTAEVDSLTTQLRTQQRSHEQSLQALQQQSEGKASTIASMENALGEERSRAAQLSSQLAEATARLAELTEGRAKLARDLEAAQKQASTAEAAVATMRAEATALRAAIAQGNEEREALTSAHRAKLAKLGMQVTAKVAALRSQQELLKTAVEGEIARVASECTHQMEAIQYKWKQQALLLHNDAAVTARLQGEAKQLRGELLELQQQVATAQRQRFEAEAAQADLAKKLALAQSQHEKVDSGLAEARAKLDVCMREKAASDTKVKAAAEDLGALITTLLAEVPLPLDLQHGLTSGDRHTFTDALQRLRREVRNYIDEHAATHVLSPIEDSLKGLQRTISSTGTASQQLPSPRTSIPGSPGSAPVPKLSPALAARVDKLVSECLSRSGKLRELEAELTRVQAAVEKTRSETIHAAEAARAEAVAPLKRELEAVKVALADVQQQYEAEMAEVRQAAQAAIKAANAEAHGMIEQLQLTASNLQAQLSAEVQRGDALGAEVSRLQGEEAGRVRPRPATVKLDPHDLELESMRARVKELEAREQKALRASNAAAVEAQRR